MTVAELIAELQKMPGDAEVSVLNYEDCGNSRDISWVVQATDGTVQLQ